MPRYQIQDEDTGRTLVIEGDSAPTEQDVLELFASLPKEPARPLETPAFRAQPVIGSTFSAPVVERGLPTTIMPQTDDWISEAIRSVPAPLAVDPRQATPRPPTSIQSLAEDDLGSLVKAGTRAIGGALDTFGSELYETGVDTMAGMMPEFSSKNVSLENPPEMWTQPSEMSTEDAIMSLPTAARIPVRIGEGLVKSAPRVAIAAANPVAGALAFGATPEGFDPKAALMAYALPIVGTKSGKFIEDVAGRMRVTKTAALEAFNRVGGIAGGAALIAADEAQKIMSLPEDERAAALELAYANLGSQILLGGIGPMESTKAVALSKALQSEPLTGKISPQQGAEVNLGLPTREATPEMLPELQRTKELVDQAIQEATQKIEVPGQMSALDQLKAQANEITPVEARVQKPQTGFERPAEEIMRGRTVAEKPMDAAPKVAEEVPAVAEKPSEVQPETTTNEGGALNPEDFVFHATTRLNANKIRDEGIEAGSWFAKTPKEAMPFSKGDPNAVVFAVKKSEIENIQADPSDIFGQEFQKAGVFLRSGKSHAPFFEVEKIGSEYRIKPSTVAKAGATAKPTSELSSRKPGEIAVDEMLAVPTSDTLPLFDRMREEGKNSTQNDGVFAGMKLSESDVPDLIKKRDELHAESMAKGEVGDFQAMSALGGKVIWLNGVIEGAKREGPNYDAVQQRLKAEKVAEAPKAAEAKPAETPAAIKPTEIDVPKDSAKYPIPENVKKEIISEYEKRIKRGMSQDKAIRAALEEVEFNNPDSPELFRRVEAREIDIKRLATQLAEADFARGRWSKPDQRSAYFTPGRESLLKETGTIWNDDGQIDLGNINSSFLKDIASLDSAKVIETMGEDAGLKWLSEVGKYKPASREVRPEVLQSIPEISISKDSALGKAISKLEEWQKNLRKPSSEGGLQMGVPKAILDLGLEAVRLTLKAGKSVAEAVEAGIRKIYDALNAEQRKSFDENALRKQLNDTIGVQSPEGMRPRSFSERAARSEMVPEDVQAEIKTDKRSSYEPQKVPVVVDEISKMTDAELGAMTTDDNRYGAARVELSKRLFKAGNKQAGKQVILDAAETMTRLGQIINQAKLLNAINPEYIVDIVDAQLAKMGKDPLRPEVADKITKLSEAKVKAQEELDVAVNKWQNDPTDANAKIAQEKLDASEAAQIALQEETLKWTSNRSIWKKLKKILQGNLLTPVSQVVNVASYFSLNPFEAATRTGASAIDILENKMMKTPRVSSVSPIGGTIQTIKGLGRGAKKIPDIMRRGSSGVVLGESSVSMNPLKAWARQFAEQPDIPTEGGKLTLKDRADLLLEGTFGMPAEIMLRGLGALDSAVKESQRARVIAEQLRLKKVPQNQWDMAMKFPEKFFDKKTLDYIESEAASAVLQRNSKSVNALNSFLNRQHPALDFAVATVAPYKLTPWNYLGKLFSYNPAVAIGRGLYEASKGNRKKANEYASRALIGGTVATAAYYLYKYGMASPSLDKSDEQQKARVLTGEVMPPNHVNISALKRVMATLAKGEKPTREDYDFRPGDETKNSFRLGGITGGMIYMMSNIGRAQERRPETGDAEFFQQAIKQSTLEQANFGLNQSFLSGVEGLLTAVKQGDESDNYLKQYSKTLLSIPLPNTLSGVGRSMREYKPDFNADTIGKKIENVVRERLSAFGATKDLPIKRDLWGEPMLETPKDANPLVYHLFSITKGQQVTDDPKALELFRLWRATDNSRIIPTPPKQAFDYEGESYHVPANLMERYTELVGKERAGIVESLVTNPNWHKLNNDEKIDELEWAYKKGMKYGKDQFWDEHKDELGKKKTKMGFQLP